MAIDENDPRLKDMLRAIELGDTLEDLDDPEEYEDQGGINSLKRKTPSIKMASEPEDEFDLELMGVINEYNDLKQKGDPAVRDISVEDYINMYLSRKKMMQENRAMAMGGGMMRMGYAGGTEPDKMGNPAVMTKIKNMREERIMNPDVEDVADYKTYYENKQDDFPIKKEGSKIDLDIEMIEKLIEKRKKEKKKLAMGGIAGVL